MNIDKVKLNSMFNEGDMEGFFSEAEKITSYLITSQFKVYDKDRADDIKQECLENLWKKIVQNKVKKDQNLFAFIWKNSSFRILEILRKESKRAKIATFHNFEDIEVNQEEKNDYNFYLGSRYVSAVVRELSTVS